MEEKIDVIAREIYGVEGVTYQLQAKKDIRKITSLGFGHLPLCVAKTPRSLSDDPKKHGVPTNSTITIRQVTISAGAGFLVPIAGDIMLMPGLPKHPAAMDIGIDDDGAISGLF